MIEIKECVYFNSVIGVCDIKGSVNCPCENYEELVRWIESENKRFTMCHEQNDINGWTMSIVDWETKEPFNYTTYEVHSSSITDTKDEMEDLCLLLNELHEENERLKEYNNKLMKQPLLFDVQTIPNTMEIMEANNKLEEENEQLKQHNTELINKIDFLERIIDGDVE